MNKIALLLSLLGLCLHPLSAQPPIWEAASLEDDTLRLQLVLHQALPKTTHGEGQLITSPPAWFSLERRNDTWLPVIATAWDYSQHEHRGWVTSWEQTGDQFEVTLRLNVRGDGWTAGGRVEFQVSGTVDDAQNIQGTYTAQMNTNMSLAYEGDLSGTLRPTAPLHRAPAGLREHPRLLFRADDLPAIRERAATPLGQAALAQMENSVAGVAFQYALTGDQAHADEAKRLLNQLMEDGEHGQNNVLSRYYAWRLEQAALAFDFCYHAWDEEFRAKVSDYMRTQMNVLMHGRGTLSNRVRWGHGGPHAPALFYAAGIAALTLQDEPGAAPSPPQPPILISEAEGRLPAADDYTPAEGIPVHDFANNVMPRDWIYVGPFPNDVFPATGVEERATLRPAIGDSLGEGDDALTWRTVEQDKLIYQGQHSGNQPRLELTGPSGVKTHTNSYYYSVLRNDADRWVRVHTGHGGVEMTLAGVPLREGDVVRLEAGLYPCLLTGPMGHMNPWAKSFAEPKWIEVDDEEVARLQEEARVRHARAEEEWELRRNVWEAMGEVHLEGLMLSRSSLHIMDMVYTEMLGRGGFLAGGDSMVGLDGPNKFAAIHRQVTGRDPGTFGEAAHTLFRNMFVHPYTGAGDRNQEINGLSGFITSAYPEGGRDTASENFATLFPLVPDAWKATALWAWQTHTGGSLENAESIARLVTPPTRNYPFSRPYGHFHTHPLFVLFHYPLEMSPADPEGVLPLTWAAPDFGFYGFRNHWKRDPSTVIAQFFSATHEEGAGTLRLYGLGHVWSHGLVDNPSGFRFSENVVQIPGMDLRDDARARVLDHQTRADGSGSLHLDLTPVLQTMVRNDRGRPVAAQEAYGNFPRKNASTDSGITGTRAMAVDYSGASGAPALVVIADDIQGAENTLWTWQLDSNRKGLKPQEIDRTVPGREVLTQEALDAATDGALMHSEEEAVEDERITILEDGFLMTQGDATLRATFLYPARPQVRLARHRTYIRNNVEVIRIDESTGILVEGEGRFLVTLTLQEGDAPSARTVDTEAGRYQVGNQTVTFSEGQLHIGTP
ncbi:MAG: hypothetical protein LAT83_09125 [Kiritimatiellae bacterium]|nr:hypothetical protein [Kiritimatiellia bacterium]